jgi:hypothetical protein
MNLDIPPFRLASAGRLAWLLLLSTVVASNSASAQVHDIIVDPCNNLNTTFAVKTGQTVPVIFNPTISATYTGNAFWEFANAGCTMVTPTSYTCAGMTVTIPPANVPQPQGAMVTIGGIGASVQTSGGFTLTVTEVATPTHTCSGTFTLHTTANGGGWGDPHLTTVDGVHYDFQSAGEFTALKEDTFEVQTRQRPVPTTTVPGPSDYTGLGVCVSTYSAVAARIGSNRVTLQPNLSGKPDPSGLQLRVNGKLVTLTDKGIDLRAGGSTESSAKLEGRIVKAAGGGYEFDNAFGTQLVATPAYWDAQQTWYLNLSIYQTSASQGIWGRLAGGGDSNSWLPALPDGTSLGSKPTALDQRYQDLYVKFANAWRVTDATSLFDYASGTNTATFTVSDWPRFNPRSCLIPGQTPAEPTTPQIAAQACNGITDRDQKADCTFDVTVTGETGFAKTYGTMQEFRPHGPGWQPALAGVAPPMPEGWPWWWVLILVLVLIVIAVLIARKIRTT